MTNELLLSQEQLYQVWQDFISRGHSDSSILRPITLQSWKRCRDIGIDPEAVTPDCLPKAQLLEKQRENQKLIEIARPYIGHLSTSLAGKPHLVALADAEGWLLDLVGTPKEFGGDRAGMRLGASWAEKEIGNNGIGTALALKEPVLICGVEHFATVYHSATCLGVPIKVGGKVVGALDISVPNKYALPSRLSLAQACVASIETTLNHYQEGQHKMTSLERFAAIGRVLATTVHDLKNPLAAVKALSQIGLEIEDARLYKDIYSRIIDQVDDLVVMIEDIIESARPEEFVATPLITLCEEIITKFEPLCLQQGIVLELIDEAYPVLPLQQRLMARSLENLIGNAIQAMPAGGTITITVGAQGNHAVIEIEDDGPGIPEEIRPFLFKPFVSTRPGGRGLGLYMVHRTITEGHGGFIRFKSETGEGTIWHIQLPMERVEDVAYEVPNIIQLKCSLCDHWKGNSGPCPGRENCKEMEFTV